MFWKFNLLTSHIDTLLDKEDVTLQEILDEDDVLQECKAQNRRLVDFLVRPENMEELVNLVTQEPSEETDEKSRYKYPNTACELLTSDVTQITEKLGAEEALLNKIYSFLEGEGPLNPLLASFFSKVMGLLITRKSELMIDFLKSKEDFVGHLLHHLGTSAIMDLLLRLITCIEAPETRQDCVTWLNEQQLVQKLVAIMDSTQQEEKHCNAAQSLCDIIRMSREQMSQLQEKAEDDPLLATIESQESVSDLLNHMFSGEKNESVLVNGLSIIQTLLEFRKIGPEGCQEQMTSLDAERLAQGVSNTLIALTPRLKDFHQLLLDPPKQHYSPMPTTIGCQDPPLGNTRLQVAKLVASLLLTNTHSVNVELARLGTTGSLLDLFFKYVWNNFLHMQVEQIISTILTNGPSQAEVSVSNEGDKEGSREKVDGPLLPQLISEFKILDKILEHWEDNEQQQTRPGGHRRGYMGHLTKIANQFVDKPEKSPNSERLNELIQELPAESREKWEGFVSGSLTEINKQNTVELVGSHGVASSSEDEDTDFRNIPFPPDSAMQQAFSDYQLQQMTSNFIDQFGFNEEEFNEQEGRVDAMFDGITSVNFEINASEDSNAATLFEQACSQKLQQFEEVDSDEDLWEEKEITFSQNAASRQNTSATSTGSKGHSGQVGSEEDEGSDGSTDSEEELNSPQRIVSAPDPSAPDSIPSITSSMAATAEKMEVDTSEQNAENWANFQSAAPMETAVSGSESITAKNGPAWAQTPQSTTEFGAPAKSGENEEEWADFKSFSSIESNLNTTDPGPRSSSPVAMDTNESVPSGRPAAYLVSSAPPDLGSEVSDAQPSSSSDSKDTSGAPDSTTDVSSSISGDGAVSSTTGFEGDISKADGSAPVTSSATGSDSTPTPSGDSSESAKPKVESTCAAMCDNNMASPCVSGSHGNAAEELAEDEDLGDNFNFLAASGLMKFSTGGSESAGSRPRADDEISSPDSLESPLAEVPSSNSAAAADNEQSKMEEIRAQAKEALAQYTSATTTNESSASQNGPV